MSSLRSLPRALLPRPPRGRTWTFLICVMLVGATGVAGSGYPVARGVSVAEARREAKALKRKVEKQPARAAPLTSAPADETTRALAAPASSAKSKPKNNSRAATKVRGRKAKRTEVEPTTEEPPTTSEPPTAPTPSPTATAPPAVVSRILPPTTAGRTQPTRTERRRRPPGRQAARGSRTRAGRPAGAARAPTFGPRIVRLASTVPVPVPVGDGEAQASPSGAGKATKDNESRTVTRTVRDIVEVVPGPLKAALGALALLSAVLAGGYVVTALRARGLARQRADLLQDIGLLQTALLPPVPDVVGALRTSVAYRPSEGPGAGGDFYDALTLPEGRSAFILGDVCGHGRQALARTAFMRYTLRAYLEAGLEPSQALQVAGPVIDDHLGGNFATVVLAVHDPRSGSLTYACAGHPAPIVVGPSRPEPVLAASSPPMGLSLRTGVRQTTVPLPPGSVACLYTDGLAEARTATGILGRPRLADIVDELGRDATAAGVIDKVAAEARLVTDDMATVVLSPTAGVTTGGFREERLEVNETEVSEGMADRFLKACGVDKPRRITAVAEAQAWAGSHAVAVLRVRFGTRGVIVDVQPRNVESLGAASRSRAMA